ncbi:MAG: hypothetical protein RR424_08460 [Oscillospiraceae bacterium]
MENRQQFSFERNRYYVGKLLTSADFLAEQNYESQKRRFINATMFGDGIVCGLGAYNLDDQSVMLDSGVAVDAQGREIVVDSAVVRKLSAIDGFETLESDHVALCLHYSEEPVQPVYAVRGQELGESYECNHVREGYSLHLIDRAKLATVSPLETEFLCNSTLYEDSNWQITLTMPAIVSAGQRVRLLLCTKALVADAPALTLDVMLQTPTFFTPEGERELHLMLEDITAEAGVAVQREYWLTTQAHPADESLLLASANSTSIKIGEESHTLSENFIMRIVVSGATPSEIVDKAIGSVNLEGRALQATEDYVPLAEIVLQRIKNGYLIERIDDGGLRRYIETMSGALLRNEYNAWYSREQGLVARESGEMLEGRHFQLSGYQEPIYATGICEIALGRNAKRGNVFYSDEVLHGLGKGCVYVSVGTDYLAEDPKLGGPKRNVIYGKSELFEKEEPPITYADTAVKVMHDRGSFVVAVKLNKDAVQVVVPLRWVAIRMPMGEESTKIQKLIGKSISAIQPTVVLAARETHFFNVKFKNMEPSTLTYELTEENSGEITADGIYTAPNKAGVYEIRISCAEMPLICTYAYAVVK